ncbi:Helicase conserved C-terminal domain-containing protein [Haloplanus vescus]|uniref:Helicase conserved C-terminal domain-containing protein n=1 Tax=Haloplanus vescus TaxID=555874 RepID=A0A1H4AW31_9EURY|nr:DEAD/DEAH box helicase [Haloplanus vescus]SEA39852.1 Helicase conserved C-terminal domain-containing protein [Haloplanus vescus]
MLNNFLSVGIFGCSTMRDGPPPVSDTLSWITDRGYYADQTVHYRVVGSQEAVTRDLEVAPPVASALSAQDIDHLYAHQVNAIDAVRAHENAVVATPTASGKTLTYVLPALERAIDHQGKTLYIAPYRALINDQEETFRTMASNLGFDASASVGVQTGDVSTRRRKELRQSQPDVLLITLDQLHYSLLPYAHSPRHWRWLFQQLETVAIDEIHMYRGVFGSHASLIFRRLNRLCEHYGANPDYICCSATIGNPIEHAAEVTGQPIDSYTLIDEDTSSSGDRHYVFWNPPLKDDAIRDEPRDIEADRPPEAALRDQQTTTDGGNSQTKSDTHETSPTSTPDPSTETNGETAESPFSISDPVDVGGGERRSNHAESVRLLADLVGKGYQTLVFTESRQGAEQNAEWTDAILRKRGQRELADDVYAYHAGLDDDRRQELEAKLRGGDAMGVWSTNALELGIDIGALDVVLLDGYPGTRMQTFQRAGRAGRGNNECLIFLIGSDNPLDQHALGNPDDLFDGGAERAAVNPANDEILPDHVVCAAADHYLSPADESHFGDALPDVITTAEEAGRLERTDEQQVRWSATDSNVQWNTDIRDIDTREIDLLDRHRDEHLVSLEYTAAVRDAHPESIYVHQKQKYRVKELDLNADTAWLESTSTNEITKAIREKEVALQDTITTETLALDGGELRATLSKMTVKEVVTGYLHFEYPDDDNPVEKSFEDPLPPSELRTTGFHLSIPDSVENRLLSRVDDDEEYLGALHAIEHTLISLLPMEVLCDRRDIGGLSILSHPQTVNGTIFVHDGYTGGAGLTRTAFESLGELLAQVRETIKMCSCDGGCPSCIHSPHCGNANRLLEKEWAILLLDELLE